MLRVKTIQREAAPSADFSSGGFPHLLQHLPQSQTSHLSTQKIILDNRKSFLMKENHSQQKKIILNKRRSFSTKENHFEQKRIILNKRRSCSTKKNSPAKTIDQSHYRYPDRCHHYFQQTPLSHGSRTHCNLFPHLIQPTPQLAKQNSASHRLHFSM